MNLFNELGWSSTGGRSGASGSADVARPAEVVRPPVSADADRNPADSAALSTRAEKLSALNQEFNIRGPGFELSSAFVQRLQEFGFISPGEAESLGADLAAGESGSGNLSPDGGGTGLADLRSVLREFSGSLEESDPLAPIFQRVDSALGTIESRDGQADNRVLESVRSQLDAALNSDLAAGLDGTMEKSLTQAMDVLLIASRLTPGSQTNAGIETYLANT